jgi:thiol-disulfide isomerase/thioredoxin
MIKLIGISSVLLALVACGSGEETSSEAATENQGTKITLDISGMTDGEKVKLWVFEDGEEKAIDSANVQGGQIVLKTVTKELREYVLDIGEKHQMVYLFADESAEDIAISGDYKDIGTNYTISGDQNSIDYHDYWMFLKPMLSEEELVTKKLGLVAASDEQALTKLQAELDSMSQIQREYAIDYIDEKPSSPVSWIMLQEFYPPAGIEQFDSSDLGYFEKVAIAMEEKYPYSEYPGYVRESITNTQAQLSKLGEGLNDAAPDLAYENPEGKIMKLSDLRGKVVLLDFWASWCGPCRKENPNVVRTYEKYKDKGFTVFSVSLDNDMNAWKAAIKADNLSWPNHVSDLKGWQSEAAAIYKVNSIPATFLLDQNGVVIAKNLRGSSLEQKLLEVL